MAALKAEDLGLQDEEDELLDVQDLPQLYTRPSSNTILATLADLSSEPPSWDATPRFGTPRTSLSGVSRPLRKRPKVKREGVPGYLTKIISSPLAWIADDGEKELIWEAAAQRLSERSGRTGMGALSRTFAIPLLAEETYAADDMSMVDIVLHEPALTADNLGLKTWASSYLLAKRLVLLRNTLSAAIESGGCGVRMLELGSGTGLLGIAAAFVLRAGILLTDLPAIVPNLEKNARNNTLLANQPHGAVEVAVLDWSLPTTLIINGERVEQAVGASFSVILVADPLYDVEHATLLPQAIAVLLSKDRRARVVMELPLREAYVAERALLRVNMQGRGLVILEQGEEVGYDDWGAADGEALAEVRCWWSVWGWR